MVSISENIKAAEEKWKEESCDESVCFPVVGPVQLRRSKKFPGALAALKFGTYKGMDKAWISDETVVWLAMILSDCPGDGGRLLNYVTKTLSKFDISLVGEPTASKPHNWSSSREWQPKSLIGWYMKHGFKIVQDRNETRVIHIGITSTISVNFKFNQ